MKGLAVKAGWFIAALLLSVQVQAGTYYFHNDHLGTPQVLTDDTQIVVWKAEYDPFGKVTETVSTVEQNLRFPGQYYDQETGLHYNYFRTYDPSAGRYVESDPIGTLISQWKFSVLPTMTIPHQLRSARNLTLNHIYGYANQNPVVSTDPLGLFSNPIPELIEDSSGTQEYQCLDDPGSSGERCFLAPNGDQHDSCTYNCYLSGETIWLSKRMDFGLSKYSPCPAFYIND